MWFDATMIANMAINTYRDTGKCPCQGLGPSLKKITAGDKKKHMQDDSGEAIPEHILKILRKFFLLVQSQDRFLAQ